MTKLLIVKSKDAFDTTYERGETFNILLITKDNSTKINTAPDTMVIDIYNSCSSITISTATMSSSVTGIYSYDYLIPANAPYGEWRIVATATKDSDVTKFPEHFIIMPWDSAQKVRGLSGIGQKKSISDDDINRLILDSYKEASHYCYAFHFREKPKTCVATCTAGYNYCIDGSNTTFFLRTTPLADWNGDGLITGFGEQSCGTDVNAVWRDCDGYCHQCDVIVQDSNCGRLTIYQQGTTTAIPSTAKGIYIDYYSRSGSFTTDLFREAVEYLTAHKIILRFGELERATSADLVSAQNIKYVSPRRMWKQYKQIMRKIYKPKIGGVY